MIKIFENTLAKRVLLPAFFFLGALLLFSCQKDDLINSGFQPEDQLSLITTDTFSFEATTIKEDSVLSFGYLYQLLGNMNEPVFGETKAGIATQLFLLEEDPSLIDASDIQIDSTLLVLDIQDLFGEDNPQDFKVQLITNFIDTADEVYSNQIPEVDPFEVGLATNVTINLTDSVAIDGENFAPGLVIPLYNTFGDFLMNNNRQALLSNTAFAEFIQGLYITSNSSFSPGEGGVVRLNLNSSATFLRVKYSSISTGEKYHSDFRIGQAAAKYNTFMSNNTGAEIESFFDNPVKSSDKLFIQSNAGAFIQLDFPFLKKLAEQELIIINKAELVIPVENDNALPYAPHPRLFITRVDEEGDEQITRDQFEGDNHYGGRYDETNSEYKLRITREVQAIISDFRDGKTPLSQFHLIPGDVIPGGAAINANRTIVSGTDKTEDQRFKIEISYTPINP